MKEKLIIIGMFAGIFLLGFILMNLVPIIVIGLPVRRKYYDFIISMLPLYMPLSEEIKDAIWAPVDEDGKTNEYWRHYIAKTIHAGLFGYYVAHVGPVWRWSKLHKAIKKRFKELQNDETKINA